MPFGHPDNNIGTLAAILDVRQLMAKMETGFGQSTFCKEIPLLDIERVARFGLFEATPQKKIFFF